VPIFVPESAELKAEVSYITYGIKPWRVGTIPLLPNAVVGFWNNSILLLVAFGPAVPTPLLSFT